MARKLGIKRLLCPVAAGVASALGLLMAPARVDRSATVAVQWEEIDWPTLEAGFARLEKDAAQVIEETGLDAKNASVTRLADMRYVGQGFEVVVALPSGPYDAASATGIQTAFEDAYRQTFSRLPPDVIIEIINIRVSMRAPVPGSGIVFNAGSGGPVEPKAHRPVYFPEPGDYVDTPVYDRAALPAGEAIAGPAIVEESESTLVVGPDATMQVDGSGNLIVELGDG